MVVGVSQIAFSLRGNDSLKGKRSVVRRIVDRTRVVSNDARHANSMLDRITSFMAGLTEAVVVERTLEILHVDGEPADLPDMAGFGDGED
jgi:uncharacterized protein